MVKSGVSLEYSTQEKRKIKEVQLSILDPDELKALSVCEITETITVDRDTNEPIYGSLADPRMGPRQKGSRCATCHGNLVNCPGHFGHIVLAKPVYHFGFLDIVKKILSCICYRCSKLKLGGDKNKQARIEKAKKIKNPEKRLNEIYKLLRTVKKCNTKNPDADPSDDQMVKEGGCGAVQPTYSVDNKENMTIIQIFEERPEGMQDPKSELSAEAALKILSKMSDEDIRTLGFDPKYNKPKNMILTVFPVAPPQVRPTVDRGGGLVSEDDLTYQYQYILKANLKLKECLEKGEASHVINSYVSTLQFYITTLSKNDFSRKSAHKNGRPIKSIRDRISSKEGRIRGNLMGKRVDFSARTVISPDPNLSLDELGVPRSIAANLTFPEPVTQRNHEFLTSLVKKATPWAWPGAKYVKKKTGESTPGNNAFNLRGFDSFKAEEDEKSNRVKRNIYLIEHDENNNSLDTSLEDLVEEGELENIDADSKKTSFRVRTKLRERRMSRLKREIAKSVSQSAGLTVKWGINME